jgi:hypothetical protein
MRVNNELLNSDMILIMIQSSNFMYMIKNIELIEEGNEFKEPIYNFLMKYINTDSIMKEWNFSNVTDYLFNYFHKK